MTTQILECVRAGEFDDVTRRAMGAAFVAAWKDLHDDSPIVRDVIASRIIDAARGGERDPGRLCDYALAGLPRRED